MDDILSRTKEERSKDKLLYEKELWSKGYKLVAGVDEVGRGPLAGPVVAACVIFPVDIDLPGLDDSKRLSPKKREEFYQEIKEECLEIGIGVVKEKEIDRLNILRASLRAMHQAVSSLKNRPDFLLVDGNQKIPEIRLPQLPVVKGDSLSLSCAAASIIAKVERDKMMRKLHRRYPQFCFDQNKGYSSKKHLKALEEFGPCKIHRRSFKRVMECLVKQENLEID